jgi:hypothetical protein
MARPQVQEGGDCLQILKVAANILSKQSRRGNKGYSASLEVRENLTTLHCKAYAVNKYHSRARTCTHS